jgi:hypothetical protein
MNTKDKDANKCVDSPVELTGYKLKFYERAFNQRRISLTKHNCSETVRDIFKYISYFNSMEEDQMLIDGRPISEWKILNEFVSFIYPNSIRYESGNRFYSDLLVREKTNFKPKYVEYHNLITRFRGFYKKDALSDVVPLQSLKVDKSFEEVRAYASVLSTADGDDKKDLVRYVDKPFIPIPIKGFINLVDKDIYFNSDKDTVIEDFIVDIYF